MRVYHLTTWYHRVKALERYGVKTDVRDARQVEAEDIAVRGRIDPFVDNKAAETYLAAKTRNRSTFGSIERVMKPLADTRDRKAVLLVEVRLRPAGPVPAGGGGGATRQRRPLLHRPPGSDLPAS
jgi:hypothetical protein